MSELFDKSIRTLELPRVLQLLADQAVSEEAKALALAVRPETDYEDVLRLLDQTDGARTMSALHGAPGFSGVKPVRELLDRADRGGSLNLPELIRIGDLLYSARRAKEYFNADNMESTALDSLFLSLHGNRFLEDKIRRCIPDENTVADAARSWGISAATCGRRWPKVARFCRKSFPLPAIPRSCRRTSSPSGTGALWCR